MRRLVLLLLGLLWGSLVFHNGGAREFMFAFLVASPLVLGAFTVGSRHIAAKYLRWLCFALLMAQSAYWFYGVWTFLFSLPTGFGAMVLVWPESESAKKLHWSVELIVVGLFIWWGWFHNPLPSDKEMIDHFNAHRAEFEQLVRGYRDFRRYLPTAEDSEQSKQIREQEAQLKRENKLTPEARRAIDEARRQLIKKFGPDYGMLPEVMALTSKLGVCCLDDIGYSWVPDPYSERAARFREGLNTRSADPKIRPRLSTPEDWQRDLPELFEGVPPITDWMHLNRHIGYVIVRPATFGKPDTSYILRLGLTIGGIYKAYWHFPQVPRIQDQRLAEPTQTRHGKPTIKLRERVFDSLDTFPFHWAESECLLRPIDPQWFLAICQP